MQQQQELHGQRLRPNTYDKQKLHKCYYSTKACKFNKINNLLNKNNFEKAEEKKKDLKALVKYGQLPLLDVIIRKDSIFNALSVPDEVIEFVEKI